MAKIKEPEPLSEQRRFALIALRAIGACRNAREWLRHEPMALSLEQIWNTCPIAPWLWWLVDAAGLTTTADMNKPLPTCHEIRERFTFWQVMSALLKTKAHLLDEAPKHAEDVKVTLRIRPGSVTLDDVMVF